MPKIVATFADGTTDVYKGKRLVKAAWKLTRPCGAVVTGHSADRATAEKTARTHIPQVSDSEIGHPFIDRPRACHAGYFSYQNAKAREHGFRDWDAAYASRQKAVAAYAARCRIEVVDI